MSSLGRDVGVEDELDVGRIAATASIAFSETCSETWFSETLVSRFFLSKFLVTCHLTL